MEVRSRFSSAPFDGEKKRLADEKLFLTIIIIFYVLILLLQNLLFFKESSSPLNPETAASSIAWYEKLQMGNPLPLENLSPVTPLFPIFVQAFYYAFGISTVSAKAALLPFLLLLAFAAFGTGREIGGRYGGIAVMTLTVSSPLILNLSRTFSLDFPLTAMTALALYLLIKSKGFRDWKYSILFGLALGLGILTNPLIIIYLALPISWYVIESAFASRRALTVFLGLLAAFLMTAGSLLYLISQKDAANAPNTILLIIGAFLPWGILGGLLIYLSFRWKSEGLFLSSGSFRMVYGTGACALAVFISTPWLFRNPGFISSLVPQDPASISLVQFITESWSFSLPLIIIGITTILIVRKDFSSYLIMILSAITTSLFLYFTGLMSTGTMGPVIIFLAPLGGCWIEHTKKARSALTVVFLLISLAVIPIHTLVPASLPIYREANYSSDAKDDLISLKLLISHLPSRLPDPAVRVAETINAEKGDKLTPVAVVYDEQLPFDKNRIITAAYMNHKRILLTNLSFKDPDKDIKTVLIVHRTHVYPREIQKKIKEAFPGHIPEYRNVEISNGISVTIVNLLPISDK